MSTPKPLTRRSFLKVATAFAAAPLILPSRTSAAPATNRINLAMIGMGRQAFYANLPPFLQSPHTQVVAVCEVDRWRMDRAKETIERHYATRAPSGSYRGCATYSDFREVLSRPDIDAVMISTPDHWHVPMAIAAAKAGKDIACEKPLTRSIAEGRLLSDTVSRYGRVFRTDSEFRSLGPMHRAVELVRNGYIGRLRRVETSVPNSDVGCPPQPVQPVPPELDYGFWLGPADVAPYTLERVHPRQSYDRPGWMRCTDYCDGMISNWGAHLNDIAQWGMNTERTGPVEIEGTGSRAPDGLWDVLLRFDVRYRYANGLELHYSNTTGRPLVRFEGEEGWVEAEFGARTLRAHPESLLTLPRRSSDLTFPFRTEKEDFIQCMLSRGTTLADAEVGHRTMSVCLLGLIAIECGRKLTFDPVTERFPNDPDANRRLARPMRAPWRL